MAIPPRCVKVLYVFLCGWTRMERVHGVGGVLSATPYFVRLVYGYHGVAVVCLMFDVR